MTTPAGWLGHAARAWLFLCVIAGIAVLVCAQATWMEARVPHGSVTGRAAAAVGDSGVFASPVVPADPQPIIPHADAESAAVAIGYRGSPAYQDLTRIGFPEIHTERRRLCGRSFYVRPVVEMPDTTSMHHLSGNDWMMWAPTWVIPICDDKGFVRSTSFLTDLPPHLRVVQGPDPRDVPELVPDSGTFPHIAGWPAKFMGGWERGVGITPETAVKVAVSVLAPTGARVADVPEAFTMVAVVDRGVLLDTAGPPLTRERRVFADLALCPRWRLTLDRPVTVRGVVSRQLVQTKTVYVGRSRNGCTGRPTLQVPEPNQPATVPFEYMDWQPPPPGSRYTGAPAVDFHWTTLRVLEPVWFEEARLGP